MSSSKFSNSFLDDLPTHRFSTNDLNMYLQDIINQLLQIRESRDPVNVRLFLSKYFKHVINGTHTIHREFKYISAIPYNRITFLFNLWNAFIPLKDKEFVNALINELPKNDIFHETDSVVLTNKQKDQSELVGESDIFSGDGKCSHKSVASECCFKTNTLINLPNKCVNSIEFLNFARGLYTESTFLLPPKLVMHKCAKPYLFHSEFNLYGLFATLATDHLLIKEMGFPQVHGS